MPFSPRPVNRSSSSLLHGSKHGRRCSFFFLSLCSLSRQQPWPTSTSMEQAPPTAMAPFPVLQRPPCHLPSHGRELHPRQWTLREIPLAPLFSQPCSSLFDFHGRPAPCPRRPGIPTAAHPLPAPPSAPWLQEASPWLTHRWPAASLAPCTLSSKKRRPYLLFPAAPPNRRAVGARQNAQLHFSMAASISLLRLPPKDSA
ncbi:uncharacterized protein [Zea mays]|uniref:uncharacterized protein n=1 Tax=Zea mays TaxID=4577 RepID=UPI0009AA1C89|nr:uncharacterized protein LOC103638413 [Zea mays]|eukprot:XP_020401813.1 uncharacterized protein LOC103638413 [Zea mays]